MKKLSVFISPIAQRWRSTPEAGGGRTAKPGGTIAPFAARWTNIRTWGRECYPHMFQDVPSPTRLMQIWPGLVERDAKKCEAVSRVIVI
jgi:hypothetical protein